MTDADVLSIKSMVAALADLRTSGGCVPTPTQAASLAQVGEKSATEALMCLLGVGVLTADHGASYLGYVAVKIAHLLAECHPEQPTTAQVLRLLANLADDCNNTFDKSLTSTNKSDQGSN